MATDLRTLMIGDVFEEASIVRCPVCEKGALQMRVIEPNGSEQEIWAHVVCVTDTAKHVLKFCNGFAGGVCYQFIPD
jgi:hypothetical protein